MNLGYNRLIFRHLNGETRFKHILDDHGIGFNIYSRLSGKCQLHMVFIIAVFISRIFKIRRTLEHQLFCVAIHLKHVLVSPTRYIYFVVFW